MAMVHSRRVVTIHRSRKLLSLLDSYACGSKEDLDGAVWQHEDILARNRRR